MGHSARVRHRRRRREQRHEAALSRCVARILCRRFRVLRQTHIEPSAKRQAQRNVDLVLARLLASFPGAKVWATVTHAGLVVRAEHE